MPDTPLIARQVIPGTPTSGKISEGTNLLSPMPRVADILNQFPPEVYTTDETSHLARLLNVLLGDAGMGGLKKQYLIARLQTTIQGSHFFDLDRFYGALFGVRRRPEEVLAIDPYTDIATPDQWTQIDAQDAAYRSRCEQFARALAYCPSPTGMELLAEALLNVDCDVYEAFTVADQIFITTNTYGTIESTYATFGAMNAKTYGDLEGGTSPSVATDLLNRWTFTIVPKRPITEDERYDVLRTVSAVKPAQAMVDVDAEGFALHTALVPASFGADSEYWEVRSAIIPSGTSTLVSQQGLKRYTGERDPNGIIIPAHPPFRYYQGEAWSYVSTVLGASAYVEDQDGHYVQDITGSLVMQQIRNLLQGGFYDLPSLWTMNPQDALEVLQDIAAGKSVADAILSVHPYNGPRPVLPYSPLSGSYAILGRSSDLAPPPMISGPTYVPSDPSPTGIVASADPNNTPFWMTLFRPFTDTNRDVVDFTFQRDVNLNIISFEVPTWPHRLEVQARDRSTGQWVTVLTKTFTDSNPRYIPVGRQWRINDFVQWQPIHENITPIVTNAVRVIMTHIDGDGPWMESPQPAVAPYTFDFSGVPDSAALNAALAAAGFHGGAGWTF